MKVFLEDKNGCSIQLDVDNTMISDLVDDLAGGNVLFFRIEDNKGNYMQCAGEGQSLTVELRMRNLIDFKHYVIGKASQSKVWATIQCAVGPIRVLEHEVLSTEDAKKLLILFNDHRDIPPFFIKRNVTKLYK